MKIAVCDDDKYSLNETINLLKQYNQISKFELDVIGFNNGDDMIESLKKHGDCQIYILDIIMKEKNGIQIAEILRKLKYNGEIIFLTNSNAFAAESYNVGAFNYILKPLDKNKLFDILDKKKKKIEQKQSSFIVISTKSGLCKLPLDDIVYAEKFGRIIRYHCKNDVVIDSLTLKTNFKEANAILLQNNKFSLCGASFVINLECVTNIQGQTLTLYNKEKLTIPRNIATSFKSLWGKYWLNEV